MVFETGISMKIGFDPFALSLSKGRSWFEADRSAVLRPKLTTNDPAYLFSFIVVPMVNGMNNSESVAHQGEEM